MPEQPGGARTTLLRDARKVDADGRVDGCWLLFSGDTVAAAGTGTPPAADEVVDAGGAWLVPGFLDLHVHGGGGHAFEEAADGGVAGVRAALDLHRRHGTTRSLISLVTAAPGRLAAALAAVADLTAEDPCVLGAHLEGPFLAPSRRGAHDPGQLRTPDEAELSRLLDAARGTLRQVTIAPELPGALAAIALLAEAGVTVAVGHTEADLALTRRAADAGARLLTHAFNAMPGIHHRAPGPVVAALADPRMTLEVVLDGRHVDPAVVALLFAAAPGRVALVTDAMAATGASDGRYRLGGLDVQVRDGVPRLAGDGPLAGSTLTQDVALRNAVELAGLDPVAAVTALTATPARVLGLDERLGRLAPGYAADAVLLDGDWSVRAVWAGGRRIAG